MSENVRAGLCEVLQCMGGAYARPDRCRAPRKCSWVLGGGRGRPSYCSAALQPLALVAPAAVVGAAGPAGMRWALCQCHVEAAHRAGYWLLLLLVGLLCLLGLLGLLRLLGLLGLLCLLLLRLLCLLRLLGLLL